MNTTWKLVDFYQENKQYENAINLLEELFEKQKSKHGESHENTLCTMNELADCYKENKQYDDEKRIRKMINKYEINEEENEKSEFLNEEESTDNRKNCCCVIM